MAEFTVNPTRVDPYKNFKFRVKWDGRYVAGVSKVSPLKRTTDVIQHREGGDPSSSRKSPGRTHFDPVTLERGVTHDPEFEKWANKVWTYGNKLGTEVSLADFRKDITLEFYNEAGQLAIAYNIFRCWVSEFQGPARPGRQCFRGRVSAHQARERRLAARRERHRAEGAEFLAGRP
jgi:phage tail-like protein